MSRLKSRRRAQRGVQFLQTRKMAVPDEHGQPQYLLALSEDVTERRRRR